jgi:polar amino acid transport system substrate-binding protein
VGARRRRNRPVVAAAALAVALGACDDVRDAGEQTFTPATPGVLRVATALPAPGYWELEAGTATGGFEYEIAAALADRFGLRLEVVDVPIERIVAGDLGGADLALSELTVTAERDEVLAFSVPYYRAGAGVLAREGEEVRDLATARDLSWGSVPGTTGESFVDDVVRPDAHAPYPNELACARAVVAAEVDACLVDLPTALVLETEVDGVDTVARFATDEQWAVALPDGAPGVGENLVVVDAAIRGLDADGSIADFEDTWLEPRFGSDPQDVPAIEART